MQVPSYSRSLHRTSFLSSTTAGHTECAFDAGLLLCSRPSVPFEAILHLLNAEAVSVQFRKVVARESSRLDVVDNLVNDRSETVRARATERQAVLASQRPP